MARLQRAGMTHRAPKLNPKQDPFKWLSDKSAPWKLLVKGKPKSQTIANHAHFEGLEKRQSPLGHAWSFVSALKHGRASEFDAWSIFVRTMERSNYGYPNSTAIDTSS
jgi:hypothetical protein